jgi:HPt (histidine-containing phosphotransfer) domain-containing protein
VDVNQALAQLEGDRELFHAVLDTFVSNLPRTLQDIEDALEAADLERLRVAANSLEGAATNVCAPSIRRLAHQLEDASRQELDDFPQTLLEQLREQATSLQDYAVALRE